MISPLNKPYRPSSLYGWRDLTGNGIKDDFHNGIDMVPQDGKHPTNILAVTDGTITDMRNNVPDSHTGLGVKDRVTGNYVNIRTVTGHTIIYRHLRHNSIPSAIKIGSQVKAGAIIGIMGTTGQSTGVHLHYEIRDRNNQSINPAPYIDNNVQLLGATIPATVHYDVRVNTGANLNIRSGAGTNFPIVTEVKNSPTLTIVEVSGGTGAKEWGRLQDGRGWVALDFTTKVSSPTSASQVKANSRVRVKRGAKTYTGGGVATFVYDRTYTVDFLSGNRAVLDSRGLNTPFNVKDLEIV